MRPTAVTARGARIIPGIEMFLRQAAMQFEQWTGKEAPLSLFREVLAEGRRDEGT